MLVFFAFAVLLVATSLLRGRDYFARTRDEWLVDGAGLIAQGVLVPLLETFAIVALLAAVAPRLRGAIDLSFAEGFLLNFVVIDYAYYWNHRLLHGALWRWHVVHHTARKLDVLVTARNTLWTPLLIVYVWLNALALFLLREPAGFLLGMSLTAALDLWRHSPLRAPRFVSLLFITPHEHAWHHSRDRTDVNFGANLSVWDRVHGTFGGDVAAPTSLGVDVAGSGWRQLLLGVERDARRLRAGRPLSSAEAR